MHYLTVYPESIMAKALMMWFVFIPIPIINGVLRELVLRPSFDEMSAQWISTLILSLIFFGYSYFMLKQDLPYLPTTEALVIGFLWIVLTILFEFSFGILVDKQSLATLLTNYDIMSGKPWILFLLLMFLTPTLLKKM